MGSVELITESGTFASRVMWLETKTEPQITNYDENGKIRILAPIFETILN